MALKLSFYRIIDNFDYCTKINNKNINMFKVIEYHMNHIQTGKGPDTFIPFDEPDVLWQNTV